MKSKFVHLNWQSPRPGEEVKLQRIELLAAFQVLSQESLVGYLKHGWEVVSLLVRLHSLEYVCFDEDVVPVDVELYVGVLALRDPPVHVLLRDLLNKRILGLYLKNQVREQNMAN